MEMMIEVDHGAALGSGGDDCVSVSSHGDRDGGGGGDGRRSGACWMWTKRPLWK